MRNTYLCFEHRRRAVLWKKYILSLGLFLLVSASLPNALRAQSFGTSNLDFNGFNGVNSGTSLMFGPDGRLYVLSLSGEIDIYTIQRIAQDDYEVTASETINTIKNIPNHNDDGSSTTTANREATGITVAGTALEPIIYVTSSDPRVGGPSGDKNLDTNSGIISRISWDSNTNTWTTVDLVRGLPRSEENHATNGLEFVTVNGVDFLIVCSGGHANAGAPSDNFAWTTEYALSAAMISVNLDMIEALPILTDPNSNRLYVYDIPTLDDPSRPNVNGITDPDTPGYDGIDDDDPFGGNDGLNQAMIVPNGPVQIFSPGYRNTYDLTLTTDGKVFVTDNGANGGWGGLPENEGTANVTNNYILGEPGSSSSTGNEQVDNKDHLTIVTDDIQTYLWNSFYGGHPTPVRANPAGAGLYTNPTANGTAGAVFRTLIYDPDGSRPNSTTDPTIGLPANWPPVPTANPVEGDWRGPTVPNPDGPDDELVTVWSNNTNGIDEYTASNFGGAMQGDLIAGKNGGVLKRVQLNPSSNPALSLNEQYASGLILNESFASNLGGNALGITCNSDTDPFPGTIWVATFNSNVVVLEPQDFVICILPGESGYDPTGDNDSDGYTNQDEIDNKDSGESDEAVICSGSNQPDDFDKSAGGTLISNLNDDDDDNDGIIDALDPMQLGDPLDGGSDAFNLPVINELLSDNPTLKGYFGLGFTGFMNNGAANPNWQDWQDIINAGPNPNDLLGGAVGAMTLQMPDGTAAGNNNDQIKGYQYGVNVDQSTSAFTIEGRLLSFDDPLQLYGTSAPANGELGIFIGDGTQSNYIQFILTQNGISANQEINDAPQGSTLSNAISVGNRPSTDVVMRMEVNALTGLVTLSYSFDSGSFQTLGTMTAAGSILTAIQQANNPLMVGLIGTSNTPGVELEGTWDYLNVAGAAPTIAQVLPDLSKTTGDPAEDIDLDNYFGDDNGVANLIYSIEANTSTSIGAAFTNGANILTLTYPNTPDNGDITIRATDGSGLFVEQTFNVDVSDAPVTLYKVNANGAQYTDGNGEVWEADNYFTGGSTFASGGLAIAGTTDDPLYQGERYGNFSYDFPVSSGNYVVELHFAEIYFGLPGGGSTGGAGSRVFNVEIEGVQELSNYDIFDEVGPATATVKSYPVTVTDGTLNIDFITVTNNAKISAIAILAQPTSGTPIAITGPVSDQTNLAGDVLNGSLVVIANGGDGNLQYTATGLPAGVFLEPTNGNINGTIDAGAAANSPYTVTVTVDDSDSDPSDVQSFSFTWTVNDPPVADLWTDQIDIENYTARHECSFVQAGDKFYLFGGRENPTNLDVFDYQTKTWTTIPNSAPEDFNHFQAVEYQGLIWVIGAFKNNAFPNEVPADFIWAYDPANNEWIQGPAIPNSRKRGSAGLVMYNDKFYVIAGNTDGHDGGYVAWFDEFDPATGTWTPLADAPRPRDHFHASLVGDKLYVAGGRESGGGSVFEPLIAEVDVYDFNTGTWSSPTNLPTPRAAPAVVNFQNEIYVIGGEVGLDLQGNAINDALKTTEAYDPSTDTWSTKDDLITERHGTQAIVSGDGIHVAAGSSSKGGGGTMKNMEYYGTDNPTGTPLAASSFIAPQNVVVPTGANAPVSLNNNGGNTAIVINDLQITGPNAANFAVGGSTFRMLGIGEALDLIVTHSGTSDNETATLTITYGDGNTVQVGLTSGQATSTTTILYRVNAGGVLVADPNALDWSADEDGTASQYLAAGGGNVFVTPGTATIDMSDPSLPAGTPVELFAQERWDPPVLPEMLWTFPVTVGANIEVRLYFAETFGGTNGITAAGERVFDVAIEGSVPAVFDDIDPFAINGLFGAFMLSHTLSMTDGFLDIEFIHDIENPNIKAIEIIQINNVSNSNPVVTNPGIQTGVEGDIVNLPIIATDADDCGSLTYFANGLPGSLTMDPNTGVISGTLDQSAGGGTAGAFIESNGLIILEAETDFVDQAGGFNLLNENGFDYLIASSNHFGNTNGQTVLYNLQITNPGVYRIQMKSDISGTNPTEENDSWLRIVNTSDVHFFCVQGGTLGSSSEFVNILGGGATSKTIYYPAGNAMGRPDHGNENPGNSGFFKAYRSGGGGNKWDVQTIDNNGFPMYAYFPNAGTFTFELSERSAGHKVDRLALTHLDLVGTGEPTGTLDGPESSQAVGGNPGAAAGSPYNVSVTVTDNCVPAGSSTINFDWVVTDVPPSGAPSALIEILPGAGLGSSTFGGNSNLSITNTSTGNIQITGVSYDFSTGVIPDMVFDPAGNGGDATAQCFTPNGALATAVGLISPADPCVDPFSQPYNGGFDVMSLSFNDFDPTEQFTFSVDIDPNNIQGVPGAGGAGSVSGLEVAGATITVNFSDGSTIVSSLYEEGSLGGAEVIVAPNAPATPSITAVGVGTGLNCVSSPNQTIEVSGTAGEYISLMVLDTRMYIQSGAPPFTPLVPAAELPFLANEAMAKQLYTAQVGVNGTVQIPVTLLQTTGSPAGSPDGGLNYIIAVQSATPYAVAQQVSMTSNVLVLDVDPVCAANNASLNINATLQARSDFSGSYSVKLYDPTDGTLLYDLTATADAAGDMSVAGIAPGSYELAVKFGNSLQKVQAITLTSGTNTASMGQLVMGDANGDNVVSLADFSILAFSYNALPSSQFFDPRADFNGDGFVTALDFSVLAFNFNVSGENPSN